MEIRQATISDINTLAKIIKTSYQTVADKFGLNKTNCPKHPSNCTDEWINADFERGVIYFILESEEKEIGCAALEKADSELCYLERLAVIPENRNKGFGRILVDYIFHEAEMFGCRNISIGIIAKQHELKKWYLDIGFKEGITKSFEHLPFEVMFMEYSLRKHKISNP
ncbi:GNAT family N-acetyltransferase [Thermodesulfobacteriota bacterium]